MLAKTQKNNITIAKSNDLRTLLKADNRAHLVKYVSKLNARKIFDTQTEAGELSLLLDHFRSRLKRLRADEKQTPKENSMIAVIKSDMEYVEKKGKELAAQLAALDVKPTLHELEKASEDDLTADLTLLIIDLDESFNIGKGLTVPQIEHLAVSIPPRMASLTLDDIALCFHRAKCGDYGTVYDRLDLNIINGWLNQYLNERKMLFQISQDSKHIASKEGMSYTPGDRASTVRVAKDRGINTDDEAHYEVYRSEFLEKVKKGGNENGK